MIQAMLVLLTLVLFPPLLVAAADECGSRTPVFKESSSVSGRFGDATVHVRVETSDFASVQPKRSGYFAVEVTTPKTVISRLEVEVSGQSVYLPLSAFGDMVDARDLCVTSGEESFSVLLRGGDASTAYEAVLSFDGQHLRSRRIYSIAFPTERWEETTYSFTH